jgi:hypothetical protein
LRPVFFWIHGGGFTSGSAADPGTDGGNLASREDIVVVHIQYRLSTLGFLAIPGTDIKGNYGIADQINALEVSKQNQLNVSRADYRSGLSKTLPISAEIQLRLLSVATQLVQAPFEPF